MDFEIKSQYKSEPVLKNLPRPAALVDENRCKKNIERMSSKAENLNIRFRPHFKTHQSIEIGNWFKDHKIDGITVSSPEMAGYFAAGGWEDITIAFPFFPGQLDAVNALTETCDLRLFANQKEIITFLDKNLLRPVSIYIEIDAGYGRTGVPAHNFSAIEQIVKTIQNSSKCKFHGFYIHDGRTYNARSHAEIKREIQPSLDSLKKLKNQYPNVVCSLGDTPSCSVVDKFEGIDEISPGNFVFYDLMQFYVGSCSMDDIAYFVECPVAEYNQLRKKLIIHGGAVHLSKDSIQADGNSSYGLVSRFSAAPDLDAADCVHLRSLSQEHGTVQFPETFKKMDFRSAGETVLISPVHSCLSANLFNSYQTFNGKTIEKRVLS